MASRLPVGEISTTRIRGQPRGLLAAGAPADEYDHEVSDLVRLVLRETSVTRREVDEIWGRWFDEHRLTDSALIALTYDLRALQIRFMTRA